MGRRGRRTKRGRMISPYRRFNGKRFSRVSVTSSKREAEKDKKIYKQRGHHVRITKSKSNNWYVVWVR